jgi:hypothetical protein
MPHGIARAHKCLPEEIQIAITQFDGKSHAHIWLVLIGEVDRLPSAAGSVNWR